MRYKSLSGSIQLFTVNYILLNAEHKFHWILYRYSVHFIYITECGINPYQDSNTVIHCKLYIIYVSKSLSGFYDIYVQYNIIFVVVFINN